MMQPVTLVGVTLWLSLSAGNALAATGSTPFLKDLLVCVKSKSAGRCASLSHASRWDYYNFVFKTIALIEPKKRGHALKAAVQQLTKKGVLRRFRAGQVAHLLKRMGEHACTTIENREVKGLRRRGKRYLAKLEQSKLPLADVTFHRAIITSYFVRPDQLWKVLFQCGPDQHALTVVRTGKDWRWGNFQHDVPPPKKSR